MLMLVNWRSLQALCSVAISILDQRSIEASVSSSSLIICPASLTTHWESEIKKFFPSHLMVGILFQNDKTSTNFPTTTDCNIHRIIIASYEMLRRDSCRFIDKVWDTVIVDEAHLIRNPLTATSTAIFSLQSKFRILLTGTPIQNQVHFLLVGF